MDKFDTFIDNIKQLPIEELSDAELDILKEHIIKLLVDIQIQKDINKKLKDTHTSMEDVQIQLMQKADVLTEETPTSIDTTQVDQQHSKDTATSDNYVSIIQTEISENIISIYSDTDDHSTSTVQQIDNISDKNNGSNEVHADKSLSNKIQFNINDKYRILRQLFSNDNKAFSEFIDMINRAHDYQRSEEIIQRYLKEKEWDERSFEFQILVAQNKKRFRSSQ